MSSLLFVHRQEGISEIFLLCQCDGVFVFDLPTWDRNGAIQEETLFFLSEIAGLFLSFFCHCKAMVAMTAL